MTLTPGQLEIPRSFFPFDRIGPLSLSPYFRPACLDCFESFDTFLRPILTIFRTRFVLLLFSRNSLSLSSSARTFQRLRAYAVPPFQLFKRLRRTQNGGRLPHSVQAAQGPWSAQGQGYSQQQLPTPWHQILRLGAEPLRLPAHQA